MLTKCLLFLATTTLLVLAEPIPSAWHHQWGGRIYGGENITIEQAPWQVSIQDSNRTPFCGGAIYNDRVIVTAAHCINPRNSSDLLVRVGATNRSQGGYLLKVSKMKVHEEFNTSTIRYDIAVILLSSKLNLKDWKNVRPIKLANAPPPNGAEAFVSGWGLTEQGIPETLKGTHVGIVDQGVCRNQYQTVCSKITEDMICAAAPGKDSCSYDSGGPLVYNDQLVGIVSWGEGCADAKFSGVYANVALLHEWIVKAAEEITLN
ncbi:trypsin alpha-3-like [Scaptodrosophila lebanonensis]|uniref:trypsin n=1 Tax=Drosophila lebanonensis TaxID=7225 RepID=A0A6J2UDJ8_DROLE|nr:trypsin alpha-3-like [Scaptodrosophila lebanonensis]